MPQSWLRTLFFFWYKKEQFETSHINNYLPRKKNTKKTRLLEADHSTLLALLATKFKRLAALEGLLRAVLALDALKTQHNLLGRLGLYFSRGEGNKTKQNKTKQRKEQERGGGWGAKGKYCMLATKKLNRVMQCPI